MREMAQMLQYYWGEIGVTLEIRFFRHGRVVRHRTGFLAG